MLRLFRRTEKTTPGIRWAYALDAAQAAQYRAEQRAAKAEAEAATATQLLDDITRAIGTAPRSVYPKQGRPIAAPHVSWPSLNRALVNAHAYLGRAL